MDEKTTQFNSEIEKAFQTAWHSERGGGEEWNRMMDNYGAVPLSDADKQTLLNSEMKIARGAFPIELRRVYEKIIEKYNVQNFDMDGKVLEYYQKIKQFGGLGDIFKNASVGTKKYSSGFQSAKQHTIKCKNCGAPRLEEMQYDSCLFCGSKLFDTENR